ncbi:hypothetical protein AT571_01830 [Acinetobacter baumannii]|uniref:Uncharacterized protein n=1 Tax=Acinetobacter baumannii TaxID=470 RepID=A0A5P9QKX3_ACIBA|nr:hypothetical protein AUO97_01820 [Acinetobacter baumannii]EGJ62208.1 hypothetical protein HMPREF0021_00009 [Acinetobacter baumannii 6013150]EGJ62668.1 hypothetical protein HMPREF0020_03671 [Acinetobacter baumannii 6013113]QDQ50778.1 hypothetical protein E5A71_01830 [Acinetobacter baumannii ATCC 17978]APX48091.1 hypothetical protein AT570_01820 [Acinetobacter baumannii]
MAYNKDSKIGLKKRIYIITRGYSPTQLKLSGGLTSIVLMLHTKLMIKHINVKRFFSMEQK